MKIKTVVKDGLIIFIIVGAVIMLGPGIPYLSGSMRFQQMDKGWEAYNAGNYEEALPYFQRSADIANASTKDYVALAKTHYALGNYSRAIAEYTNALNINPDYTQALIGRADAYEATGAYKLAEYDRQKIIVNERSK